METRNYNKLARRLNISEKKSSAIKLASLIGKKVTQNEIDMLYDIYVNQNDYYETASKYGYSSDLEYIHPKIAGIIKRIENYYNGINYKGEVVSLSALNRVTPSIRKYFESQKISNITKFAKDVKNDPFDWIAKYPNTTSSQKKSIERFLYTNGFNIGSCYDYIDNIKDKASSVEEGLSKLLNIDIRKFEKFPLNVLMKDILTPLQFEIINGLFYKDVSIFPYMHKHGYSNNQITLNRNDALILIALHYNTIDIYGNYRIEDLEDNVSKDFGIDKSEFKKIPLEDCLTTSFQTKTMFLFLAKHLFRYEDSFIMYLLRKSHATYKQVLDNIDVKIKSYYAITSSITTNNLISKIQTYPVLSIAKGALSKREYQAFEGIFKGQSSAETAKLLDITKKQFLELYNKAQKKLQRFYDGVDEDGNIIDIDVLSFMDSTKKALKKSQIYDINTVINLIKSDPYGWAAKHNIYKAREADVLKTLRQYNIIEDVSDDEKVAESLKISKNKIKILPIAEAAEILNIEAIKLKVVYDLALYKKTLAEIARETGVTLSRIGQIYDTTARLLYKYYDAFDEDMTPIKIFSLNIPSCIVKRFLESGINDISELKSFIVHKPFDWNVYVGVSGKEKIRIEHFIGIENEGEQYFNPKEEKLLQLINKENIPTPLLERGKRVTDSIEVLKEIQKNSSSDFLKRNNIFKLSEIFQLIYENPHSWHIKFDLSVERKRKIENDLLYYLGWKDCPRIDNHDFGFSNGFLNQLKAYGLKQVVDTASFIEYKGTVALRMNKRDKFLFKHIKWLTASNKMIFNNNYSDIYKFSNDNSIAVNLNAGISKLKLPSNVFSVLMKSGIENIKTLIAKIFSNDNKNNIYSCFSLTEKLAINCALEEYGIDLTQVDTKTFMTIDNIFTEEYSNERNLLFRNNMFFVIDIINIIDKDANNWYKKIKNCGVKRKENIERVLFLYLCLS